MSGLYLLLVLGIWAGLTWGIVRGWRRWLAREGIVRWHVHALFGLLLSCWLGVTFWYGGGRKVYYDTLVNRMCREDGGVKVYEQVRLPAERFDKYGNVNVPNKRYAKPSDDYYFETEIQYLVAGNPSLERAKTVLVRRNDKKVLGESVRYGRGGGDLPGPWHGSSFNCPPIAEAEGKLETSIFLKEETPK